MKNNLFTTLSFLALTAFPAISSASFLNNLEGTYKIGGNKCKFESITMPTGRASITSGTSGATVKIEVIISGLKTEIPVSFRNSSGDEKKTTMEGDILRLPIARRTVWNTDEVKLVSTISEYEGIVFPKLTGSYSLREANNSVLKLRLEIPGSDLIECLMVRN
jgi:hypothetical protein